MVLEDVSSRVGSWKAILPSCDWFRTNMAGTRRYYSKAASCSEQVSRTANGLSNKQLRGCTQHFPVQPWELRLLFFPLPLQKKTPQSCNANQVGLLLKPGSLNTVKKVACGPTIVPGGFFFFWSRLVSTLWVPGTSRALCFGFPECGTPPKPSLGLRSQPQELRPHANICHPEENRRAPSLIPTGAVMSSQSSITLASQ